MRAHYYCGKGKPSEDSCCILHAETPTTPLACRRLGCRDPPPSLPCPDARSVCGSAVSLPPAPTLPLCVTGRLRFALRCSLAAHARTALRLAVVLVHRSWRLKLTHPPPPPTSPPRLRTPRRLCALVRSQVGIPGPASVVRACRAARAASLSHHRKGSLVALRSARRTSALVLQEESPVWRSLAFRVAERGMMFRTVCASSYIPNQGFWRDLALRYEP